MLGILSGLGVHNTKYFGSTILAVKPSPSPLKRRIIMQQTCKFMYVVSYLEVAHQSLREMSCAVNTNNRHKRGLQLSGTAHPGLGLWSVQELWGIAVKMPAAALGAEGGK